MSPTSTLEELAGTLDADEMTGLGARLARPRHDPDWEIWGTWEYHVQTISGQGNLVRPSHTGA